MEQNARFLRSISKSENDLKLDEKVFCVGSLIFMYKVLMWDGSNFQGNRDVKPR